MEIEKFTSLTQLPSSGVQKRTLKGLCGRLKQVEGRVDAAYQGLNVALNDTIAKAVATLSLAFESEIRKRDEKISSLEARIASLELDGIGDLEPAVETPDRGVQPA